jgi:hypothetical protein
MVVDVLPVSMVMALMEISLFKAVFQDGMPKRVGMQKKPNFRSSFTLNEKHLPKTSGRRFLFRNLRNG